MDPMLGREAKEGKYSFPVLGQAGDRLVVLGAVLVGEYINGRLGCRAGRRTVNFTKVCLHVDLDREGNFVQHVGGLVNPTPLVPGARKDLLNGLPEAERAVADRQVGRDLEPTLLDVDEEFTPALCALPHPGLEADQFLLAFGGRTDQHEHAFSGRFHPGLQVEPIRPHVYVSPGQEGGERLLEIAGRYSAQIENRQQRVETLRPPRPLRQDRRGETDLFLRAYLAAVADLGATNLDRPDAGLDRAMRPMAVTHDAVATIR